MKLLKFCTILAALAFVAICILLAHSDGAPSEAITASNMCIQSGCHTGTLNGTAGLLTVSGFPSSYTPGTAYNMTVTVKKNPTVSAAAARAGFAAFVNKDGTGNSPSIGTLALTDTGTKLDVATTINGLIRYVTHNSTLRTSGTGDINFTFRWTAPSTTSGNVVLVVGSNSANGNGMETGDFISKSTFTATPAAVNCTFTIAPTTQALPAAGGDGSIAVTASDSSCTWTASSNASFITISSGATGTGNGTVNFSVAANTTDSVRTGTLTVAGQTFTVTQAAPAPENEKVEFSQFGDGGGLTSTFEIINRSSTQTVSGTVRLFDSGGNPITVNINTKAAPGDSLNTAVVNGSFTFSIPPLGVGFYSTDGKSSSVQVGSAQLSSTLPVAATILFASSAGTTGVGAVTPLQHFSVPIEMDIPKGILTGVAIANPTGSPVTVTLQLRDTNGNPVSGGSTTITLAANGQVARFPNEMFLLLNLNQFKGTLEVTAPVGQDGMAVRVSPGQFSTLPVAAIN
ncbi:MAG TPA: BACON domain-containing protein [Acidobacteriota bacterium]|jgi:hypothetical protein